MSNETTHQNEQRPSPAKPWPMQEDVFDRIDTQHLEKPVENGGPAQFIGLDIMVGPAEEDADGHTLRLWARFVKATVPADGCLYVLIEKDTPKAEALRRLDKIRDYLDSEWDTFTSRPEGYSAVIAEWQDAHLPQLWAHERIQRAAKLLRECAEARYGAGTKKTSKQRAGVMFIKEFRDSEVVIGNVLTEYAEERGYGADAVNDVLAFMRFTITQLEAKKGKVGDA